MRPLLKFRRISTIRQLIETKLPERREGSCEGCACKDGDRRTELQGATAGYHAKNRQEPPLDSSAYPY